MTEVPTETTNTATFNTYRNRKGDEFNIKEMEIVDLIHALFDMLQRKAKHNHKLNKMLEVGETLGGVVKAIHTELAERPNCEMSEVHMLQAMADLGKLQLKESDERVELICES
mgnify:CR=1 FL=1